MPTAIGGGKYSQKTDDKSPMPSSAPLPGFADAAPSPMAKPKPSIRPLFASSPIDEARIKSSSLIQSALLSSLESNYAKIQKERDEMQLRLSEESTNADVMRLAVLNLKKEIENVKKDHDEERSRLREEVEKERRKREEAEEKLRWTGERCDRLEGEGEELRKEISRLSHTNEEHAALLTQVQSHQSFSTSQVIPLKLEVTRLQQELDMVTCHSNHIEVELANRNQALAQVRNDYARDMRLIKGEADEMRWEMERRDRESSSVLRSLASAQTKIELTRKIFHDKECQFIEQRERMELDLNKERELVALKDQAMMIANDKKVAVLKELDDVQALAREAAEREHRMENELQAMIREEVENAVRITKQDEEVKRMQLENRLKEAEDSKMRLEDDILNKGTPSKRRSRAMEIGTATLAITDGSTTLLQNDAPVSLTDLYARLAETEDDLRSEQHDNRRLKILIDRIRRDVESKTPIFHQKQLELESALEQLDEFRERLDYARGEVTDIRADNQDLEFSNQQLQRECKEFKRENIDLAKQVQHLLHRGIDQVGDDDSVTFESIRTLQEQNQKLLRDHRSMSEKILTLEDRINSNPEKLELDHLKEEVVMLREEREKQSKLVAGIVHQRDLYRALVTKNDAEFLENENSNQQLVLADSRAEQLPYIEARNRELLDECTKLRSNISLLNHEKEALDGRLARLESHADELATSNQRLHTELTATDATSARNELDVSHYKGRCERLEATLDGMKEEKESEVNRRNRMEHLNLQLQSHLDGARSELAKKQQQFETASSKLNMRQLQLENVRISEARITAEANELRAEIARQGSLLVSVQRIEASLSAKSESERENLEREVERQKVIIANDEAKYSEIIQKLEGKISDLELSIKDLTSQKEYSDRSAVDGKAEVTQLKVSLQDISNKHKTVEQELVLAKRKLGDVTVDTDADQSLEAKVLSLSSELELTKADLEKAKERVATFQNIAKSSENQLAELTAASTKYKHESEANLEKLRKSEMSQKEAVADLTKDLLAYREEKEKCVNEFKSKIESLTVQLTIAKKDLEQSITRMESLTDEMNSYQLNASNAQNNYERELALHAEARSALRDSRLKAENERRLRESTGVTIESLRAEIAAKESIWQTENTKLEKLLQEDKTRIEDMRRQNILLHEQMTTLTDTIDQFQSNRANLLVGNKDYSEADPAVKTLSDLRELLRFKQSECIMLVAELSSVKRSMERERTSAELVKKSLDEARSELKLHRDKNEGSSNTLDKDVEELRNKLRAADEQLVLVRESNTMHREESQRITKKLAELQDECNDLKSAASPHTDRIKTLEVEKAALEVEKECLSREVDAWKSRVQTLVSKFNQIDPEEHAQALASIGTMKTECSSLKNLKEKAEDEVASAKSLIARLNQQVSSQKSAIDALKAEVVQIKAEKVELVKSAQSGEITKRTLIDAQATARKSEAEMKVLKAEHDHSKSRLENLMRVLNSLKEREKKSKDAEEKAMATVDELKKQITELNLKVSEASHAFADLPSEVVTAAVLPTVTSEKESEEIQTKIVEKSQPAPVEVSEKKTVDSPTETQTRKKVRKRKANSSTSAAVAGDNKNVPPKKKSALSDEVNQTKNTVEIKESEKTGLASTNISATANKTPPSDETIVQSKTLATTSTVVDSRAAQAHADKDVHPAPSPSTATVPIDAATSNKSAPLTNSNTTPSATNPRRTQIQKLGTRSAKKSADPPKETPPRGVAGLAPSGDSKKTEDKKQEILQETKPTTVKPTTVPGTALVQKPPIGVVIESSSTSTVDSKNEEEMKRKMVLLKKRKAVAALKLDAAKKKQETEPPTALASGASDTSKQPSVPSVADTASRDSSMESAAHSLSVKTSPHPFISKSENKSASETSSQKPLPPILENEITNYDHCGKSDSLIQLDEENTKLPVSLPVLTTSALGPSSTVSEIELPHSFGLPTEPNCPKPSFQETCGSTTFPSTIKPAYGAVSETAALPKKESLDKSTKLSTAPEVGAFLSLTPPGKSGTASPFVFGSSAIITLPMPSTHGLFSQKAQLGEPPFASGESGLDALTSVAASAEKVLEPIDSEKIEDSLEGEIKKEASSTEKDGAM